VLVFAVVNGDVEGAGDPLVLAETRGGFFDLGVFTHVVLVAQGNCLSFYKNGVLFNHTMNNESFEPVTMTRQAHRLGGQRSDYMALCCNKSVGTGAGKTQGT